MIALVDCNNFYASCERAFRPEYNGKPIVVLSNNDGCVIARSNEAKAIGIPMGIPLHMIDKDLEKQLIKFSSNYTLYADMSSRVMNNLARFTPFVDVYSIDECFLRFARHEADIPLYDYAHKLRTEVIQNTGIPISVGLAPSKTLAKLANKLAKKGTGVCMLDTDERITEAVDSFPVDDLWGIGRAGFRKLQAQGIDTAGQLRAQPIEWIKKVFTIQGVRMWYELWGKSCIPMTTVFERKKGVCTSRSFGKATGDYGQLQEATTNYASRVAEKLREDTSCATMLSVRLITNQFRTDLPQYYPSLVQSLPFPVNNTPDLVKHALVALKKIYKPGYQFIKVEIFATGLIPEHEVQLNVFQDWKGSGRDKVSKVMDTLNKHYGSGTIRIATESAKPEWAMKRKFLSPEYTTRWADIPKC